MRDYFMTTVTWNISGFAYQTSGTRLTGTSTCAYPNDKLGETYTATPTQLMYFRDVSSTCAAAKLVLTYTKQ